MLRDNRPWRRSNLPLKGQNYGWKACMLYTISHRQFRQVLKSMNDAFSKLCLVYATVSARNIKDNRRSRFIPHSGNVRPRKFTYQSPEVRAHTSPVLSSRFRSNFHTSGTLIWPQRNGQLSLKRKLPRSTLLSTWITGYLPSCDQCLPSPPPPNTGLPPSSFVLNSQALTSNPAATEAIKKHIRQTPKSDKPAELPAIYKALMSYRYWTAVM